MILRGTPDEFRALTESDMIWLTGIDKEDKEALIKPTFMNVIDDCATARFVQNNWILLI